MLGRAIRAGEWLALGWGHRGLVLDVGSGNSPHPRADVLCDRFLGQTRHRHGAQLVRDRALVCSDAGALPFETGAFAFAIARHVLEHLPADRIAEAIGELARVARAGYIETPSPLCEMLMPDPEHKSFVEMRGGCLVFVPKQEVFPFPPVARALLELRKRERRWQRFISDNAPLLTTVLRWRERIPYRVETPRLYPACFEASAEMLARISDIAERQSEASVQARRWAKDMARFVFLLAGGSRAGAAKGARASRI